MTLEPVDLMIQTLGINHLNFLEVEVIINRSSSPPIMMSILNRSNPYKSKLEIPSNFIRISNQLIRTRGHQQGKS